MSSVSVRSQGRPLVSIRAAQSARRLACLRGLRFIHQHSLDEQNFEDWSGDYLWCFYCVASTSRDAELKSLSWELGRHCARRWMASQNALPELADAGEVAYYVSLLHSVRLFGIDNPRLCRCVRRGVRRFTAREYLGFDALREPPTASNGQSRYDVWCDALVLAYTGEVFGTPLGVRYSELLRWLPEVRPYRGAEGGTNPEFRDIAFAVTHLVYTLNDYSRYRLPPQWLPQEFEFLRSNLNEPFVAGDLELLGEFLDSLRSFGMAENDPAFLNAIEHLLSSQNPDGSWGDIHEPDPHIRYHAAWTAIDALRDYDWRERTLWPAGVKPDGVR